MNCAAHAGEEGNYALATLEVHFYETLVELDAAPEAVGMIWASIELLALCLIAAIARSALVAKAEQG